MVKSFHENTFPRNVLVLLSYLLNTFPDSPDEGLKLEASVFECFTFAS